MPPKSRYSHTQSEAVSSERGQKNDIQQEKWSTRVFGDAGSRACLVVSCDNLFPLQLLALVLEEPKEACDEVELLTALSLGAILRPDLLVFSPLIFSFLLQLICQGQGTSVSCFQLHFATHCSMCVLGIKDQQLLCNLFMIMKDLWEIEFLYKSNDLILNLDVHN